MQFNNYKSAALDELFLQWWATNYAGIKVTYGMAATHIAFAKHVEQTRIEEVLTHLALQRKGD